MRSVHVSLSNLSMRDREVLESRARQLARPDAVEVMGLGSGTYVSFMLRGSACAVEAHAVDRVVRLLGSVVPVAGSARGVAGVTFVENQPFLVLDLAADAGKPRPMSVLARAPALQIRSPVTQVIVAVEGPLELLDVLRVSPLQSSGAGDLSSLQLSGRLPDGTYVVDSTWLLHFAEALGG